MAQSPEAKPGIIGEPGKDIFPPDLSGFTSYTLRPQTLPEIYRDLTTAHAAVEPSLGKPGDWDGATHFLERMRTEPLEIVLHPNSFVLPNSNDKTWKEQQGMVDFTPTLLIRDEAEMVEVTPRILPFHETLALVAAHYQATGKYLSGDRRQAIRTSSVVRLFHASEEEHTATIIAIDNYPIHTEFRSSGSHRENLSIAPVLVVTRRFPLPGRDVSFRKI